ncbi:hypothetical protein [Nocardia sp. NPDC003963]
MGAPGHRARRHRSAVGGDFRIADNLVSARGRCIAIVHRFYDDDDKLVVVPPDGPVLDDEAIAAAVGFQENSGEYIIVRH